jgi:acetyltransferase-like isoleucine patch superfamily enzyme
MNILGDIAGASIILTFVLVILDLILMCFYCRFAEKMDERWFSKKNIVNKKEIKEKILHQNNSSTKIILSKVYNFFNSYMYGLMRYTLICVGNLPSHRLRKFLYKYVFRMKINKKTVIYGGSEIRSPWNITIKNAVISIGCILDGRQKIFIGDNVVFGTGVHLWTEEHAVNDPFFRVLDENRQGIIIKDRAWICSDATILPGVTIEEGAVVAARACVTKDCAAYTINGGVPAKKIGDRNNQLEYELTGKPTWHFY